MRNYSLIKFYLGLKAMDFDEYLSNVPEDELDKLSLCEVWDAAVDATVAALLEAGNISAHYRDEWVATKNSIKCVQERKAT